MKLFNKLFKNWKRSLDQFKNTFLEIRNYQNKQKNMDNYKKISLKVLIKIKKTDLFKIQNLISYNIAQESST